MAHVKLSTIQIVLMAHYEKLLIQIIHMAHVCENDMIQIKDMFQRVTAFVAAVVSAFPGCRSRSADGLECIVPQCTWWSVRGPECSLLGCTYP